jgi:hypothetical protein
MTANVHIQPLHETSLKKTQLPALEKLLQPPLGEMLLVAHLDEKLSLELLISRLTPRNPGGQLAVVR